MIGQINYRVAVDEFHNGTFFLKSKREITAVKSAENKASVHVYSMHLKFID